MSIRSEITRLETAKAAIAAAIANKGVTVPPGTTLDGMATLINSIVTGTGTGDEALSCTNVLDTAVDADGSLYNGGQGYKENTRFSTSSRSETTATGWDITGYIAAKRGDIIRMRDVEFLDMDGSTGGTSRAMVYLFDGSFGYLTCSDCYTASNLMTDAWAAVYGTDGNLVQFTIPASYSSSTAYIRIGASDINAKSVITVNEEIA